MQRTPADAYRRLGALVTALELLRPPPQAELVGRAVEAILRGAHKLLEHSDRAEFAASCANRAAEVGKIADVLTRLLETVGAPAGPGPLETARAGVSELRREIANVLDRSRRSLPVILAQMQSKNWHERKKAFAGACTVFRVLSDGQIKEALDALSDDIRNVETKHVADAKFTEYLLNLAHVLSHYTSTLTSDQVTAATTLVVRLLDQLRRTGVPSELLDLARGIALVAEKTRCDRAFAILVFGALKYPLAPREPLVNVVRSRFPDAPRSDSGFWELIVWARGHFPDLDLTAPQESETIAAALFAEIF